MTENIDSEILISLVQTRPVLWDKTLDVYKDRNATRNAWDEVCSELNKDFEVMEKTRKNEFGKEVVRRWTNLRDAFAKSRKKLQNSKKSGSGAPTMKKYVFNDQMQFLNKTYDSRDTADSLENTVFDKDELVEDEQLHTLSEDMGEETQGRITEILPNKRRRKLDEIELKMLKALEPEQPNSHMSFFQGVIPHLSKFDNDEVLQFQMGVLQVISNINEKKKATQSQSNYYHHQQLPVSLHPRKNPFLTPTNMNLPQSTGQYYENSTSLDSYPTDSSSPAVSGTSENTPNITFY